MLKSREMQLAKYKREAEKVGWEIKRWKTLAESYKNEIKRLQETIKNLEKTLERGLQPVKARPVPSTFTNVLTLKAWEDYFWRKFEAELLRVAPEVDPKKYKSLFKDNMEAFYDVLRAGGTVTRDDILADIIRKVNEITAKLKAKAPAVTPVAPPSAIYGLPKEYGRIASEYGVETKKLSDKFNEYLEMIGLTFDEYLGLPSEFKKQIDRWFISWLFEKKG